MSGWKLIATAPKSKGVKTKHGTHVTGIYLLGYCPEYEAVDPKSCICVIWWEPEMSGGVWYGEGADEVHPTHWMHLPEPPK